MQQKALPTIVLYLIHGYITLKYQEYATQHDLPVSISIDGSYGEDGIATTSICIVAPDIRDTDTLDGNEWQNRRENCY